MKFLEPGARMGVCLFIGQAVGLKVLDALQSNDVIGRGWYLTLSTAVLIAGWQTVQYAYHRGLRDASLADGKPSPDGEHF